MSSLCIEPDQTPQNVASDQGLHCLLTECSIKIRKKMKNTTQQALTRNGLVQLIRMGKSIWFKWVKQDKENYVDSSSVTTVPITFNNIAYKQTLDYMITQSITCKYYVQTMVAYFCHEMRDDIVSI